MRGRDASLKFLAGRLSLDFVNSVSPSAELSWESLISFLKAAHIVSPERGRELLALNRSDPHSAEALLRQAQRLAWAARKAFEAQVENQKVPREWIEPVNEILRVTEGHDELVSADDAWQIEFMAREGGLEWLLAAVARSVAEIIAEGTGAPLRVCANPRCGLFFYDTSRTRQRRWCSMAACGNRSKVAAFARRQVSVQRATA